MIFYIDYRDHIILCTYNIYIYIIELLSISLLRSHCMKLRSPPAGATRALTRRPGRRIERSPRRTDGPRVAPPKRFSKHFQVFLSVFKRFPMVFAFLGLLLSPKSSQSLRKMACGLATLCHTKSRGSGAGDTCMPVPLTTSCHPFPHQFYAPFAENRGRPTPQTPCALDPLPLVDHGDLSPLQQRDGHHLLRGHEPLHGLHMRRSLRSLLLEQRPELRQLPGDLSRSSRSYGIYIYSIIISIYSIYILYHNIAYDYHLLKAFKGS